MVLKLLRLSNQTRFKPKSPFNPGRRQIPFDFISQFNRVYIFGNNSSNFHNIYKLDVYLKLLKEVN